MSFNIFQRVFKFAMLADGVNNMQNTRKELEKSLKQQVTDEIKGTEWQLKWGPAVWKLKPDEKTPPGNAWYIVYHPNAQFEDGSHPTYVIAVAGTPLNCKDIVSKEDNAVDVVVDFNAWASLTGVQSEPVDVTWQHVTPNTPYISKGTAWGTFHLLDTKFSEDAVSPGNTILEYFSALKPPSSTRFIITGHSLGGALTTTLALTLVSVGALPSGNTLTYPMAGFSAGNAEWASVFTKCFPPSEPATGHKGWNRNLVNNLDIFPQLWCTVETASPEQWIGRISTIYGTKTPAEAETQAKEYSKMPSTSGVLYHPIPSFYFDGTAPLSTPEHFEREVLIQHCFEYYPVVGLPKPPLPPPKKPGSFEHPVAGGL